MKGPSGLPGRMKESWFSSVPLSHYEKEIDSTCPTFFSSRTQWRAGYDRMKSHFMCQLLEEPETKRLLKYVFPIRRYKAATTIFTTATLAGYSTFPSLFGTAKSSMSFLMKLTSLNPRERMEMLRNTGQAEFYKSIKDNPVSSAESLACFQFPNPEEFLGQFMELLKEMVKTFPSVLWMTV